MVSVKPFLLSLTKAAFALGVPPDGTVTTGMLRPVLGARRWPPDVSAVRAQLTAAADAAGQVDLVLVLEAGDADPELTGAAVAAQLAGVARLRGVAVVERADVVGVLAAVKPEIASDFSDDSVIAAVNTLVSSDFTGVQASEAWATSLLVTGMGKKFSTTTMLELLRQGPPAPVPRRVPEVNPVSDHEEGPPVQAPGPGAADRRQLVPTPAPVTPTVPTLDDMKPSTMLTVDDIVRLFSVSRSFAYELKGHVPFFNFGGLRFRKGDIEDYLRSRERRPTSLLNRKNPRGGTLVASTAGDDDEEVVPGVTRRELRKKAGF